MDPLEQILPTITAKVKLLPAGFTLDYYYTYSMTLKEGKSHHLAHALIVPSICSSLCPFRKDVSVPRAPSRWPFGSSVGQSLCPFEAMPKNTSFHSLLFCVLFIPQSGFNGFSLERLLPSQLKKLLFSIQHCVCSIALFTQLSAWFTWFTYLFSFSLCLSWLLASWWQELSCILTI